MLFETLRQLAQPVGKRREPFVVLFQISHPRFNAVQVAAPGEIVQNLQIRPLAAG